MVWRVARDPQLLRIQTSFLGFAFAEHATWLAILVFAYARGGVGEAGVVAVVQLAPAIVVAPFAAYAGDRFRPERVLAFGYAAQAVSMWRDGGGDVGRPTLLAYVAVPRPQHASRSAGPSWGRSFRSSPARRTTSWPPTW